MTGLVTLGRRSWVAPRAAHRVPLFPQKVSPCVAFARGWTVAGMSLRQGSTAGTPLSHCHGHCQGGGTEGPQHLLPSCLALCPLVPSQLRVHTILGQTGPCCALPCQNVQQDRAVHSCAVPCHAKPGQAVLCRATLGCATLGCAGLCWLQDRSQLDRNKLGTPLPGCTPRLCRARLYRARCAVPVPCQTLSRAPNRAQRASPVPCGASPAPCQPRARC